MVGLVSAVMTLSKTVLYWMQEYYCGGCSVGHNDFYTLFVYWIIPNGYANSLVSRLQPLLMRLVIRLWLLVPAVIVYVLSRDIAGSLRTVARLNTKKASGKKQ